VHPDGVFGRAVRESNAPNGERQCRRVEPAADEKLDALDAPSPPIAMGTDSPLLDIGLVGFRSDRIDQFGDERVVGSRKRVLDIARRRVGSRTNSSSTPATCAGACPVSPAARSTIHSRPFAIVTAIAGTP